MTATDLAVLGAGPAGGAAAVTAARLGLHVTLVDEYPQPGGQYLRGTAAPVSPAERRGRRLLAELAGLPVTLHLQTLVWGVEGRRLGLAGPTGPDWLEAGAIIAATGARELALPFPGWTLPGVMTAGGLQLLAKDHGVLPGQKILLAGSGPLLLAAAHTLLKTGAHVVAVLEASRPGQWLRHAPALWGQAHRLAEGWRYLRALRQAGVPYCPGQTVVQAEGQPELEGVITARLDRLGRPIPGSEERLAVDTLGVSFGFIPNTEFTQLAGCEHHFDPARGGWTPNLDDRFETTVPGLFAAGELAGVGGAAWAMLSGQAAAWAAAARLGRISQTQLAAQAARLAGPIRREQRFAAMLNTLFAPPPGLQAMLTADTLVCRCEGVTAGEIGQAVAQGATSLDALKIWSRVGQGPCQGRTCGPLLARMLAQHTGRSPAEVGYFSARPPLKPVSLAELAGEGQP